MRRSVRLFVTLAIMAIFATGAYAFTAWNEVPETNAGFGSNAINGYDVQFAGYIVDETSSTLPQITGVKFYFFQDSTGVNPVVVKARVNEDSNFGPPCSHVSGLWTCDVGPIDVNEANTLQVLAYDG